MKKNVIYKRESQKEVSFFVKKGYNKTKLYHSDANTLVLNYVSGGYRMTGKMENELGKVVIDNEVIATYAGSVAVECFGIVGMAAVNMKDGLVKLLKRDYLTHGINVTVDEENNITIDFHVIVAYGVSIETVSDNLISTVKYQVEEFTGMKIAKINIYVEGVRVID